MFALVAYIPELAQRYCDYVFSHAISTADSCRTYFNIHTQKPALARTSLTLSTFIDRLGSRNNILLVSFPSNWLPSPEIFPISTSRPHRWQKLLLVLTVMTTAVLWCSYATRRPRSTRVLHSLSPAPPVWRRYSLESNSEHQDIRGSDTLSVQSSRYISAHFRASARFDHRYERVVGEYSINLQISYGY